MSDEERTKQQLIEEVTELRLRAAQQEVELDALRQAEVQQQAMEEAVRLSEAKWRSVVSNAPVFVAILDDQDKLQYLNRAVPGFTLEDVIGRSISEYLDAEHVDKARETIARVRQTGESAIYECQGAGPNGTVACYETHVGPVLVKGEIVAVSLISLDITSRKRSETALRESERMLRTLMSNLPGMVYRCRNDPQWTMEFVSEGALRLTGYEAVDLIQNRKAAYGDLIHQDDRQSVWDQVQEALASYRRFAMEYRIQTLKGEERWVCEQGVGVFAEDGALQALEGFITDVTDRRRAEAALQEANNELERRVRKRTAQLEAANLRLQQGVEDRRKVEATLDAFFEASLAVLNILDEDLRYVKVDGLTPVYLGLDSRSILGRSAREVAPGFIEGFAPRIERVIKTGEPSHNVEVRAPLPARAGEVAYWRASYFPVPLAEGRTGCGIVAIEITDMARTEEALRQSHDQLRAIYNSMVDGIIVTDRESLRFLRVNASACQMLGYTEEEFLSLTVEDIHPPEVLATIIDKIRTARESMIPPTANLPVIRKDGSVFFAEVIGSFVVYNGRVCSMGIFRDITERKKAQEDLERERRTLRHMLRASDHERQLIAYDIHDGLAQKLAAAIMQFQTHVHLKDRAAERAATSYDAGMEMLRQAHAEARRLISGVRPPVLDESGPAVAIAHLVHEQVTSTVPSIEYHDDVQFKRLAPILENALYRIAQEAVTNACQHSGSDRIRVSLVQEDDRLRVEVRDWGVGFDPQAVGENRFGLEGIRERTRLLDGVCSIESEPGKGTCVSVTFPIGAAR